MLVLWLAMLALAGWAAWRLAQPERSAVTGATWTPPAFEQVAGIEIQPKAGLSKGGRAKDSKEKRVLLRRGQGKDAGWQVRVGDGWKPARRDLVERFVGDLTGMRISRVVAHGSAHDADLGLADGADVTLRDASGKTLLAVTVGRQGEDLLSTYLRVHGRPEVVAVDRALVWQVRRPLSGWVAETPKPPKPKPRPASGPTAKPASP